MSIQGISNEPPLMSVPAEAAVKTASMALSNQKLEGQAVMQLLNSAQIQSDPSLGNLVNVLA